MNSATGVGGEPGRGRRPHLAADALPRLRAALAGAGLDLTPGELADALWLALAARRPEQAAPAPEAAEQQPAVRAAGPHPPPDSGPEAAEPPEAAPYVGPDDPEPAPAPGAGRSPARTPPGEVARPGGVYGASPAPFRTSVYALTDTRPGTGAAAVRVPGVPGLPNPLALVRALRPLKRRVSSLHRFELDEAATAETIADTGGTDIVLRPERARWLDLVLAVDDGLALRVWQDTLAELTRVLGTSGIFRTVRRVGFASTAVNSAVVDGNRTAVLAVTDGVGPAWRTGAAHRTLAAWARKAPTAVLQPLPLRLWSGTALPAERLRVRTNRPAPANPALRAYDPWLPPHLATPLQLPVPVLELGDWSLGPWAALIASHGGSATLHVVDAAAPPVRPAQPPPPGAESGPAATKRLLAFQETVSPEAYELAAHLASVDPLTLPVMRVVQAAALPGSSPSCLAEVLLSGLMRLGEPLAGFDVFTFDPEVRHLLRMVVPATSARRTIDAVTDFITPRLGRSLDFPALIASRTGTLQLPSGGSPFAEVALAAPGPGPDAVGPPHPDKRYAVAVRTPDGDLTTGYLVADGLVLTADMRDSVEAEPPRDVRIESDRPEPGLAARLVQRSGDALLYRVSASDRARLPRGRPVRWGQVAAEDTSYAVTAVAVEVYADPILPVPPQTVLHVKRTTARAEPPAPPGDRPAMTARQITHFLGPLRMSIDQTGAVIFDGDTLCGLVTPNREPIGDGDQECDIVTPVTSFALAPGFYDAIGAPEIDWFRPGQIVPDPDPEPGTDPAPDPAPRAEPERNPAPESAPDPDAGPDRRPDPAGPAPGPQASADAGPATARAAYGGVPAPHGALTPDEEDALRELERLALPPGGPATGVLVLRGTVGGPAAVAAEFVHRHAGAYIRVIWVADAPAPTFRPVATADERPVLVVQDGITGQVPRRYPLGPGVLVLSLGDAEAGLGYQEIHLGPVPGVTRPVTYPLSGTPAPPAAPPLGGFPPLAPPPAAPAPGGRPQPAAWEPEEIRAQLMELLLWLREEVSFDILETLWPPELLARTLGSLHSGGTARVNWTRRYVSLTSVSWNPVGNSDPGGRALAERALLAAYEEEESVSPRRGAVDEDRLATHVLKLADRIPPEDDNADDARLYSRAGRHLLFTDDVPTGVRLCERALSYAELRYPPDSPVVGTLTVDSRAELADLAVPETGLRGFLALSPETVAAYRPPGVTGSDRMVRIHRELTQAEPLRRALDSDALPAYQRALAWCTSNLGRSHRLTDHLLDVVTDLRRGGWSPPR